MFLVRSHDGPPGPHGIAGVDLTTDGGVEVLGEAGRDLLVIDGAFFPDTGLTARHVLELCRADAELRNWQRVKGRYAAAYIRASDHAVILFTDHIGTQD